MGQVLSCFPQNIPGDCWSDTPWFYCVDNKIMYGQQVSQSMETFDWTSIPPDLDPAAGELNAERSWRYAIIVFFCCNFMKSFHLSKRRQILSLVLPVEEEISRLTAEQINTKSVVEFGAGSGHVVLLLAFRSVGFL